MLRTHHYTCHSMQDAEEFHKMFAIHDYTFSESRKLLKSHLDIGCWGEMLKKQRTNAYLSNNLCNIIFEKKKLAKRGRKMSKTAVLLT